MLRLALAVSVATAPNPKPCSGSDTISINACADAEFKRTDAVLNRYYQAAQHRLQEEKQTKTAALLVQSQRSWIAYRDAECDAVYQNWIDGTIRGSMAIGCKINLTQIRTYAIWRNWLTYMDSTPPILPRPDIKSATQDDAQ